MSTPTPVFVTEPPALEAPRYGLASVLQGPTGSDSRWQAAGVRYDTDHCAHASHVDGMCPVITPGPPVTEAANITLKVQTVTPPPVTASVTWTTADEPGATFKQHMVLAKDGSNVVTIDNQAASGTGNKTVHFKLSTDAAPGTVLLEDDLTEAGLPQDITSHVTDGTTYRLTWSYAGGSVTPATLTFDPATIPAAPGTTQDLTLTDPVSTYTLKATSTAASSPVAVDVGGDKKTLAAGSSVQWTGQSAGAKTATYTSTAGTVTPGTTALTLPLASGTVENLSIQPAATYTYTATSDAASKFAVTLTSTPTGVAGTVAPGQTTAPKTIAADAYAVTATGGVEGNGEFVVPGADYPIAFTRQVPGPSTSTHDKPLLEGLTFVDGYPPFTIYTRFECNPVGIGNDGAQRALRRLALAEYQEVEKKYWTQLLNDPDLVALRPLDTANDFKEALGTLEHRARFLYNGVPTLHFPMWTQPYFSDFDLIEDADRDGVMRTKLGSKVAFYVGDGGDLPGAPAGSFLGFATGTVRAYASEPFVNEAFDHVTNTRTYLAERTWALDNDCLTAAIRFDLTGLG